VSTLLVVAGEASGDRAAAAVLGHLPSVRAFGLGGPALASRGVELACDLRASTALGFGEAMARAWGVAQAWRALTRAIRARRPRAALLVDYTEFNGRLAPRLRADGVPVVWYGAPQIWAWRSQRAVAFRARVDRMAVMLPFEERLWRSAGVDAHYVGHPAIEGPMLGRDAARGTLGMTPYAAAVAILPGSRPHEVRRLLEPMLEAYERVRSDRASVDARVLLASSLDDATRAWMVAACAARRVQVFDVDPHTGALGVLGAFEATLCASGTASLEAVLAHAVPVVAYRVGLTSELAARALLATQHVALPNVLLGRKAFPELLQRDVQAPRLAKALADVLDRRDEFVATCNEVERTLGDARTPSTAVARLLAPMLGVQSPDAA
jgi:lipid-A-disaccharide synthase